MNENVDLLAGSLLDLFRTLASPQRDSLLLRTAGVDLDRALFPLLVLVARGGPLSVVDLADQVGRDHSTVSRQLAKLEQLGLVERLAGHDRRVRAATLTKGGREVVGAITSARRLLLGRILESWSKEDVAALAALNRRFADAMMKTTESHLALAAGLSP